MAMTELWKSPSPSSSFLEGVLLKVLPKRSCVLSFSTEGASGGWEAFELRFHEVAAFKCTYLPALTAEMIRSAYDTLVNLESSAWLAEASSVRSDPSEAGLLRHLRICFDDGPCYEFLCTGFDAVRGPET